MVDVSDAVLPFELALVQKLGLEQGGRFQVGTGRAAGRRRCLPDLLSSLANPLWQVWPVLMPWLVSLSQRSSMAELVDIAMSRGERPFMRAQKTSGIAVPDRLGPFVPVYSMRPISKGDEEDEWHDAEDSDDAFDEFHDVGEDHHAAAAASGSSPEGVPSRLTEHNIDLKGAAHAAPASQAAGPAEAAPVDLPHTQAETQGVALPSHDQHASSSRPAAVPSHDAEPAQGQPSAPSATEQQAAAGPEAELAEAAPPELTEQEKEVSTALPSCSHLQH